MRKPPEVPNIAVLMILADPVTIIGEVVNAKENSAHRLMF